MKNLICCMFLLLVGLMPVSGQNTIKMDPDLKSNSTALEAKRKAITTFPKYQFGPYAIVSAKAGWTITKGSTKMRFILEDTNSESKTKSSFVLVCNKWSSSPQGRLPIIKSGSIFMSLTKSVLK